LYGTSELRMRGALANPDDMMIWYGFFLPTGKKVLLIEHLILTATECHHLPYGITHVCSPATRHKYVHLCLVAGEHTPSCE